MQGVKANKQDGAPLESLAQPKSTPGSQNSFIAEGIAVDGKISGNGNLVIGGTVTGEIHLAKNRVSIEKSGRIEANIRSESIIIEGSFKGKLTAQGLVNLKESARFEGELKAARLQMEEGAKLKGSVELTQ